MYTNADCTVFNKTLDAVKRMDVWHRTVIKNVYWEDMSGERISSSGLSNDCKAFVVIPCSADFGSKKYMKPKAFSNNPGSAFTLAPDSIIIRGVIATDISANFTVANLHSLDDAHTILSVNDFCYGSAAIQHWEVQAK